ncbi:MAG: conjugal transfer protein TraO [Allomuricauda sp.]
MRKVFIAILIIVSIQETYSQRSDLAFGLVPSYRANGYGINLKVNRYHNATDYVQLSLIATFAKEQPDAAIEFLYEDYIVNLGYFTTVLTWPNRGFSIFFGGGASGGYEKINNGEPNVVFENQIPKSGLVYGGFASFELDFFLSNSFSLIVPVTGIYHFNSKVDKSMLLLGAGVRFYLK